MNDIARENSKRRCNDDLDMLWDIELKLRALLKRTESTPTITNRRLQVPLLGALEHLETVQREVLAELGGYTRTEHKRDNTSTT